MSRTITNARGITMPAATLYFVSGATVTAARSLVSPETPETRVLGLDPEGRIVLHFYPDSPDGGWRFGLTLCCHATDKGTEVGVVCRGCYGDADVGVYDPRVADPLQGWE